MLAGIPEADGIVGDLGGGSVELVRVRPPRRRQAGRRREDRPRDQSAARAAAPWPSSTAAPRQFPTRSTGRWRRRRSTRAKPGQSLYLVGGAARAIARLHMEHTHYPLHIIHHYTIARGEAEAFFDIIGRLSRKSLERIMTISRKRLEVVPLAALDPAPADHRDRSPTGGVFRLWAARGLCFRARAAGRARPRSADCRVYEIRPDREPLSARGRPAARMDSAAVPEPDRAGAAAASGRLLAWRLCLDRASRLSRRRRHSPAACGYRLPPSPIPSGCLSPRSCIPGMAAPATTRSANRRRHCSTLRLAGEVRTLGLALRLAYTLTGRTDRPAVGTWLGRDRGNLVLEVPPTDGLFAGETVHRRLDAVARSLGAAAIVRPREPRRLAGD